LVKIISTNKTNAIFLAIVLVAGTIFTFSPSFMIPGAEAFLMDNNYNSYEPDYGMDSYDDKQSYKKDNNYYKSKDSNVKCNNINVNLNGFSGNEIGTTPTALSGLATGEAQTADEGEIGASSFGSGSGSDGGRPSGHDSDSRFVCINNNNNVRVGDDDDDQPIPTNLDLAVVNFVDNDVSILLGNGDGTFTEEPTESPVTVGTGPFSVAVGDFNGDTNLDLAVANFNGGAASTVSILLGNGDGTFEPVDPEPTVGSGPISVAVGLFDDDNILDLAVANRDSNTVSILLGDGNGNFDPAPAPSPIEVGISPLFVAVGDYNGDEILDLAVTVANFFANDPKVYIFLGIGDGTFDENAPPIIDLVDGNPNFIGVGSFNPNTDNFLDLAVTNGDSSSPHNTVSILLGDGAGTFTEEPTESPITVGNNPFAVVVGLFDDDTIPDLAVSNSKDDTVSILLGDGDGTFTPTIPATIQVGAFPQYVAVGDFNGDTNLDLAIANGGDGNVSILLGDGNGNFDPATPATVDVGNNPIGLAVGEFDGL
jgi:FG-GAP-like repeat